MSDKANFTIKEGDTQPTFEYRLSRHNRPIDLRDATAVEFKVAEAGSDSLAIDSTATIVQASKGVVEYTFGETTLPEGDYDAEFRIDWGGGDEQTVPHDGYLRIVVDERIDGEIDPDEWDDPDITVTTVYADNLAANTGSTVSLTDGLDAGGTDIDNVGALHTAGIENVADHIVDESDDLKDVLNNQIEGGDIVFVGPGEYVHKNIKPSVDNVRLVGANPFTTTIKLSPDADGTSPTYDELFSLIDTTGWTVENLTFDGNKANVTDPGNMEDSFNCINVVNSTNISVQNCRLMNNWANALYFTNGSRDFEAINNYVENCTSGILCYNQWRSRSDSTTRDGKIQNNTVIDLTDPQENGPWGIYLSGNTTNVDIADNYVRNADNGVRLNEVTRNNVTDNTLVDCYRAGVLLTQTAAENKVEGNMIDCDPTDAGPVDGIYATDTGTQDRNKLVDNYITTPQRHGINIASGEDLILENNAIHEPGGRGISLDAPTSGRVADTVVIGPGQDTANIAIHVNSGTFEIDGLFVRDTLGTLTRAVNLGGGTDHSLGGEIRVVGTDIVTNSVTGVTFKGILGGGPLGGVDLSTVTGQHDGQGAMSDGTATGFPQYSKATWDDANAQWVRADGQATI